MTNMFKVLIAVRDPRSKYLKRYLSDIADVTEIGLTTEELKKEIKKDYDVLVTGIYLPISSDIINSASPKLKIIATYSVGIDHIDVKTAEKNGIEIVNAAIGDICASKYSVAEHAFALLLSIIRKTYRCPDTIKRYRWMDLKTGKIPIFPSVELFGKTLGIIGVGRIGSHIARIGKGFCMNIVGYDPYVDKERVWEYGVRLLKDLKELLKESDFIMIAASLTRETKGMIGIREVSIMKNGVYIVNVSRGAIVDENAIVNGIKNGKIAGYAADVLTEEPPTFGESPLYTEFLNNKLNILISPHIAPLTDKAPERYARIISDKIRMILLK